MDWSYDHQLTRYTLANAFIQETIFFFSLEKFFFEHY